MRRFVTGLSIFSTVLIVLIIMCVLTSSAKMTAFLVNKEYSIAVSRGKTGLSESQNVIREAVKEVANVSSRQAFSDMTSLIYDRNVTISEEEAHSIYKTGFLNRMRHGLGDDNESLIESLNAMLPELKTGTVTINSDNPPFYSMDDESIYVKNINLVYQYKDSYQKKESFDVDVPIGTLFLYDGNEELFGYSIVATKGMYITGKTSTIFGNIYAGVHDPSEMRDAEALYGEKNYYGGINIMSTQVAVYSDKIVSEGALNMKGAFSLFGNYAQPAKVYAKEVNETDNIANRNIYELIGEFIPKVDNPPEREMIDEAMAKFNDIDFYYDSDNDEAYTGKYRKIISSSDVTLYDDVTGIVMTPRSIIVEEGVNVEGLIISGDRVYIQGNNNIVSSPEVLRGIIKEEKREGSCIDETKVFDSSMSMIHLRVMDYLGGIKERGVDREE